MLIRDFWYAVITLPVRVCILQLEHLMFSPVFPTGKHWDWRCSQSVMVPEKVNIATTFYTHDVHA